MMTHDIEPIIDMIKSLSHIFDPVPTACFLTLKSGIVSEITVSKSDIISFSQVCKDNLTNTNEIIRLIYLRRYYEILDDKGSEYQLISNLLHKRDAPLIKNSISDRLMTEEEIHLASDNIRKHLQNFEYEELLQSITDSTKMKDIYNLTDNKYEKIQLFRIINNQNHANDIIKKYINETFHIENEYVMQLNPHKYDFVPDYIIAECDNLVCQCIESA